MATNILMPALSPTMEEGTLAKWLVKEGDTVKSGTILAEIETDKATMEVEAVDEGTVGKLLIPAGTEDVLVNTPIAVILGEGEKMGDAPAAVAPAAVIVGFLLTALDLTARSFVVFVVVVVVAARVELDQLADLLLVVVVVVARGGQLSLVPLFGIFDGGVLALVSLRLRLRVFFFFFFFIFFIFLLAPGGSHRFELLFLLFLLFGLGARPSVEARERDPLLLLLRLLLLLLLPLLLHLP